MAVMNIPGSCQRQETPDVTTPALAKHLLRVRHAGNADERARFILSRRPVNTPFPLSSALLIRTRPPRSVFQEPSHDTPGRIRWAPFYEQNVDPDVGFRPSRQINDNIENDLTTIRS